MGETASGFAVGQRAGQGARAAKTITGAGVLPFAAVGDGTAMRPERP